MLLFSGGKDSVVVLHLAAKAFFPGRVPFPVLHVDTGHNFPEVLAFRDETVARLGVRLEVASVQDYIDDGRLHERSDGTRNPLQTLPLLDAIAAGKHDAVFGGARRDEDKARAKERIISLRDEFGQWDPRNQRPELWSLYNGRHTPGQHVRAFPISNWTELDVWRYLEREQIPLPPLYFAHEREVYARDGMWRAVGEFSPARADETVERRVVRYRTVGDMSCTGAVESDAADLHVHRGRDRPLHPDRARRDARRRPHLGGRDGRPQEGRVLLMTVVQDAQRTGLESSTLFRFATAGSVDDGKSTLVGRLLHDSKAILADQLEQVARTSAERGFAHGAFDFALLTDGLRAEREQGITIDVAYRYFSTGNRSFILADCPGHVQYTRNMVTGATTADAVIVLIDGRKGVLEQTRRHLAVIALLRVPHVIVAVNKIDLLGYAQDAFARVRRAGRRPSPPSSASRTSTCIPVSALEGDNIVDRSEHTPWYEGPALLELLEALPGQDELESRSGRLPPAGAARAAPAGRPVAAGRRGGRRVAARLPCIGRAHLVGHRAGGRPRRRSSRPASAPPSRRLAVGGVAGRSCRRPAVRVGAARRRRRRGARCRDRRRRHAADRPSRDRRRAVPARRPPAHHRCARARQARHRHRAGRRSLRSSRATTSMRSPTSPPTRSTANDIGRARLRLAADLPLEPYSANRAGGSFLVIHPSDGATLAAGIVRD